MDGTDDNDDYDKMKLRAWKRNGTLQVEWSTKTYGYSVNINIDKV